MPNLREVLNSLEGRIAILPHRHADIDALVSAFLIYNRIENSEIIVFQDMNFSAKSLASKFNIPYTEFSDSILEGFDGFVVVDTSTKEMLRILEGFENKVRLLIDHHEESPSKISSEYYFIDREAIATVEIIYRELKEELTPVEKKLVAVAMLSDSFRFKRLTRRATKLFYEILESTGEEYEELLKLAFPNKPVEEKIATINSIASLNYVVVGDWVVSYTTTKNSNGEIAGILASFCDVAIVFKKREEGLGASLRCNEFFDYPLNNIAKELASSFGGAGGGHKKASGIIIPNADERIVGKVVEKLVEILDRISKS